jgi:trans-2,3-dihydro-3-hydroxyanthranilate isomerase
MELRYRIVDVFTDRPLAGNGLCVVLDPVDDERLMQAIAREVNLSETTFVRPAADGASYDVRIFTPSIELPFAGHPTLGTAWCLGVGRWTQRSPGATVGVEVTAAGAVMVQPTPTFTEVYPEDAADALGLPAASATKAYAAEIGGTRHLLVPVSESTAIDRLRPDGAKVMAATAAVRATGLGVVRRVDERTLHARVFVADAAGIFEDPGTGSAAGPFGVLASRLWDMAPDLVVLQGDEMGRPCRLDVHVADGDLRVGGAVAACAEGRFTL